MQNSELNQTVGLRETQKKKYITPPWSHQPLISAEADVELNRICFLFWAFLIIVLQDLWQNGEKQHQLLLDAV